MKPISIVDIIINFYQKYLSPLLVPFGFECRYYPTCSEYSKLSIKKHGIIKGSIKSILRLLRCNPLFKGGKDLP
ncbi:MAG: membrane protein insertion efficiency factor YidD [bacterium]|nr:membrane protein insertion efficiency factor YidD [bacterium]